MPIRPLSEVYLKARWSIQTNKSTFDPAIPSKERLCCPVLLQLDARHCDFTLSDDTHTQRLALSVFLIHFQWHVGALCSATFIPAEDPYPSIQRWEMLLNGFFHTFRPLVTVWMPVGLCAISTDLYLDGTKYALRGCLLSSAGWMALFDLSLQSPVQKRWNFLPGSLRQYGKRQQPTSWVQSTCYLKSKFYEAM